jgi:chemotaxis-related protein WspD
MRPIPTGDLTDAGAEVYDCWNRIGVRGDKSCPELQQHSHCRNCPAYSAAAATLLDREIVNPPEPAANRRFVETSRTGEGNTESVVIFRLGTEWFALSTLLLDEIVGMRPVHSLPHRRNPAMLGLVNVRGELVVCISIARLLIGEAAPIPVGRLMVVRQANGRLAFPVDEVQHAERYGPSELKPVPASIARSASAYTKGLISWHDKMVGCLDERLVLAALDRSLT